MIVLVVCCVVVLKGGNKANATPVSLFMVMLEQLTVLIDFWSSHNYKNQLVFGVWRICGLVTN